MGNQSSSKSTKATTKSLRSERSVGRRKAALTSLPRSIGRALSEYVPRRRSLRQRLEVTGPHPGEEAVAAWNNLEHLEARFEIEPMELKMQRNLCGCHHPYARVDLVWASTIGDDDSGSERTLLVDRHISLRAHESDVSAAEHELKVMCYLAGVQLEQGYPQHRHLVRLHGHFQHQGTLHVLTEYCHHGTLMMLMEVDSALHQMRQPRLPHFADVNALRSCTTQICTGVAHLHRHGVAHLDLAIENIFIDEEGVFKVGDFRFAKYVSTFNKPSGLSQPLRDAYAAPETHFGFEIDLLKADAWSVGVILFMLWTRQIPFEETTHDDPKFVALRVAGLRAFLHQLNSAKHPYVVPEDVLLVLEGFLSCDPKDRKTVIESLELHPWLCGDHDRIAPAPDSTSASTAADPAPVSSPIEQFSV